MPKIYRLNDYDWVAAESFDEALNWYMNETGLPKNEALDEGWSPYEVSDLSKFMVRVEKGIDVAYKELEEKYSNDDDGLLFKVPADELLKVEWNGKPYLFCSAE